MYDLKINMQNIGCFLKSTQGNWNRTQCSSELNYLYIIRIMTKLLAKNFSTNVVWYDTKMRLFCT